MTSMVMHTPFYTQAHAHTYAICAPTHAKTYMHMYKASHTYTTHTLHTHTHMHTDVSYTPTAVPRAVASAYARGPVIEVAEEHALDECHVQVQACHSQGGGGHLLLGVWAVPRRDMQPSCRQLARQNAKQGSEAVSHQAVAHHENPAACVGEGGRQRCVEYLYHYSHRQRCVIPRILEPLHMVDHGHRPFRVIMPLIMQS